MTRYFTIRNFFRNISNHFLSEYFKKQGVLEEVDFSALKETDPTEFLKYWNDLPEETQKSIQAEFSIIFDLGSEKGCRAILDAAQMHHHDTPSELANFIQAFSKHTSYYHKAMHAYLKCNDIWYLANILYQVDSLSSNWRKRKNLGHYNAASDVESLQCLANSIQEHMHFIEGRGQNCLVEHYKRGDLDYYIVYAEDFAQENLSWSSGNLIRQQSSPVFEIVYVYSRNDGSLDLHFKGSFKAAEPLQFFFARNILKLDELPLDPADERIYDLNPLRDRNFEFIFSPLGRIKSVHVRKIRFSSKVKKGRKYIVEAQPDFDPEGVYDQMDDINPIKLSLCNVTQVEIVAEVINATTGRVNKFPFRLTYPNTCSLKYDELDLLLKQVLVDSGIELKEPEAETKEEDELTSQ